MLGGANFGYLNSVYVQNGGTTALNADFDNFIGLVTPSLNTRLSGNELILSWSTNAVGFTLQSTLHLTPPRTWVDSTNPPTVIGSQFTVTNAISRSAQFYRLRKSY